MTAPLPRVLLVEHDFVLRRTIAATARQLGVADVHEATSLAAAQRLARIKRYDIAVLALDVAPREQVAAFVRTGVADVVIGVAADAEMASKVPVGVHEVLARPLRVKTLLGLLRLRTSATETTAEWGPAATG